MCPRSGTARWVSLVATERPSIDRKVFFWSKPQSSKGVTLFDTAEAYGPFTNEELVGDALAPLGRAD
jgi:hypothetical protein